MNVDKKEYSLKEIKQHWTCSKKEDTIIFSKYNSIEENVLIPSCIENTSSYAFKLFSSNYNVTDIVFSEGIKKLEFIKPTGKTSRFLVFQKLEKLRRVYLPLSLEKLIIPSFDNFITDKDEVEIFIGNQNIKTSNVVESNNIFYICNDKSINKYSIKEGVKEIFNLAFNGCDKLVDITIPNSVELINTRSFYSCKSLVNLVIPNSVKVINEGVFFHCENLKSIKLSDNLEYISERLFYRCSSLNNIILPNSINTIGEYAFYNCSTLESITIPNSILKIEKNTFANCSSLKEVKLSDNLETIDYAAFAECTSLSTIHIPSSVVNINRAAFTGCKNITLTTSLKEEDKPSGWDINCNIIWGCKK